MREEIIKMAREAGWRVDPEGEILEGDDWHIQTDIVERFFHMAQAAEREACAKEAEGWKYLPEDNFTKEQIVENMSKTIAHYIRARGQA